MSLVEKLFGSFSDRELKKINPIAKQVLALEEKYAAMPDADLQAQTAVFKQQLADGKTTDDILPDAFAVCREAAWRVLGMKHFPVQVIGGIALHRGDISEMQTGEGKTLVATLPAYLNALTGEGVHVVTVNDYLAKRDSEWMGKLYRWLGLSVGLIAQGMDGDARRAAYAADITYGTNNEFGFDYLRDNMVTYKANMVQRGHAYAIVDEVDSILIDEARTPLIISGRGEDSSSLYTQVDRFVRTLRKSVVVELEDKVSTDEQTDGDYVVDEKHKTCTLTASGIKKAEAYFKVENLAAAENMTLAHHIDQAIKAYGVMQRDIDYVVKDGQVIIVDEFTGRLMIGRRYNEGLHQAIEAKEGVKIAAESKTLATITFQNYFRMYKKLSGMTGTAKTEATEFTEIYGLNIVTVPTNRPRQRIDYPDAIYKTVNGKYNAVIQQVLECHQKGQPVLVGTVSVEKSETLAKMLQKYTRDFNVLNAKNHEREAEIVAQAGKKGAITIATNMAGRGTDIVLGGNAEYMAKADLRRAGFNGEVISEATGYAESNNPDVLEARRQFAENQARYKEEIKIEAEKVREAGGLFILGTERHEARRIDNQLRGRSGRQGDPGASRFFLSLEDDILRLFGSDRIAKLMDTMKIDEDTPIDAKMLSSAIENAQKKVESRNFQARKDVLDYDDVMNTQREVIYGERRKVLSGENMKEVILGMVDSVIERAIHGAAGERQHLTNAEFQDAVAEFRNVFLTSEELIFTDEELASKSIDDLIALVKERAIDIYNKKEVILGEPLMRELERVMLLRVVDEYWMEHIDAMDDLKQGIRLRAYGQEDPVVAYKRQSFDMFDQMTLAIQDETVRRVYIAQVRRNRLERRPVAQAVRESREDPAMVAAQQTTGKVDRVAENEAEKPKRMPIVKGKKIGRNEPCPCGSGLKFKNCHGKNGATTYTPDEEEN